MLSWPHGKPLALLNNAISLSSNTGPSSSRLRTDFFEGVENRKDADSPMADLAGDKCNAICGEGSGVRFRVLSAFSMSSISSMSGFTFQTPLSSGLLMYGLEILRFRIFPGPLECLRGFLQHHIASAINNKTENPVIETPAIIPFLFDRPFVG